MNVHFHDAARQPATRWVDVLHLHRGYEWDWRGRRERIVTKRIVHRIPANKLLRASCCNQRRPAKNLEVKAFYDMVIVFCRRGKGCKA